MIHVLTPFPSDWLFQLWGWLHEYPDANKDDSSPKHFDEFAELMSGRFHGEQSWGVLKNGLPCGFIGYQPVSSEIGLLHGICFARGHCNRIEKRQIVGNILEGLFKSGVHKISATYFANNLKIAVFLDNLGFECEGLLKQHAKQHGKWIDLQFVSRIKEN